MRIAVTISCVAVFFTALALPLRLAAENNDQTADSSLVELRVDRAKYAAEFGESHPTVKMLDRKIDAVSAENNDQTADSDLVELRVERAKYAAEFGESHPTVKTLDKKIDAVSKLQVPAAQPDVTKMDDAELRSTVQRLLSRVDRLEREIAELKERRPNSELIKQ